jgi:hypothetical protein
MVIKFLAYYMLFTNLCPRTAEVYLQPEIYSSLLSHFILVKQILLCYTIIGRAPSYMFS